jgi:hypothetical protein
LLFFWVAPRDQHFALVEKLRLCVFVQAIKPAPAPAVGNFQPVFDHEAALPKPVDPRAVLKGYSGEFDRGNPSVPRTQQCKDLSLLASIGDQSGPWFHSRASGFGVARSTQTHMMGIVDFSNPASRRCLRL